jgi:serine/threonine protein kinase
LKEIGKEVFSNSVLKSIRIPNNVEKLGDECFCCCEYLSEIVFESESKLKEIGNEAFYDCPLKCVRMEEGFGVKYNWPKDCIIEYISHSSDDERGKKLNISDYVIDLDDEYEFGEGIGGIELWRKVESGEEVAVKNYKLEKGEESEKYVQETFLREVQALFRLKHPFILSLKGYCLPKGREGPKLVTEYMRNGSLKAILALGSEAPRWWTVKRRVECVIGIVLGMKYIHSKGFIHRDLKPGNIFIDDDGRIRIGDFGSSRSFETGVTMASVGTPLYMAPEVGEGHYDCKVDVYSFGLIMYEIVTNDAIFSAAGSKLEIFRQLLNGWRPDLSNVTPLSRSIIERSWSMNAKERPTFDDIWRERYNDGFDIIAGVSKSEVAAFLIWAEGCGGEMD